MIDASHAPGGAARIARLGLILTAFVGGCALGPKALEKTHGRYQESVRKVEEEQFLRDLVHLR